MLLKAHRLKKDGEGMKIKLNKKEKRRGGEERGGEGKKKRGGEERGGEGKEEERRREKRRGKGKEIQDDLIRGSWPLIQV